MRRYDRNRFAGNGDIMGTKKYGGRWYSLEKSPFALVGFSERAQKKYGFRVRAFPKFWGIQYKK